MKANPFQTIFARVFPPPGNATRDPTRSQTCECNSAELEIRAIVDEAILPQIGGRVRYRNSWWPAVCPQNITLRPGEIVYVVGRYNLTLFVQPAKNFFNSVENPTTPVM